MSKIFKLLALAITLTCGAATTCAQQVFVAYLSGRQVAVVPTTSNGRGFATAKLNAAETQLTVSLTYTGLINVATEAHIHEGAIHLNGVVRFSFSSASGTSGTLTQTFNITPAQVQELRSGLLHIDVHTVAFNGGEIRGQFKVADKRTDYDGDSRADIAVWRNSTGFYYIRNSLGGQRWQQWGQPGDTPVPADYDGDGRTDLAVFRSGAWYILESFNNTFRAQPFGQAGGDVPLPADYDGDAKADLAVYRAASGIWYILNSSTGTATGEQFGINTDMPVPGDYDRDGNVDLAVFRPSENIWYIKRSSTGTLFAQQFGASGDQLVPQDYDADGGTDIAIFRPAGGGWYILRSSDNTIMGVQFGASGDIAIPRDYGGDAKADFSVFRPRSPPGTDSYRYILHNIPNGLDIIYQWGISGDLVSNL